MRYILAVYSRQNRRQNSRRLGVDWHCPFWRSIRFVTLCVSLMLFAVPVVLADNDDLQTIKTIEAEIKRGNISETTLAQWAETLTSISGSSTKCISESQKKVELITADLAAIGEKHKGEAAEVTEQRKTLQKEKLTIEKTLASCSVRSQLSQELLATVTGEFNKLRAQRLFAQGPTFKDLLITDSSKKLDELISTSKTFLLKHTGFSEFGIVPAVLLILMVMVCIRLGIGIRRGSRLWVDKRTWTEDFSSCFYRSIAISLSYYAPYLLSSAIAAIFVYILFRNLETTLFIEWIAYGLPFVFLLNTIIRLLIWPPAPAELCFNLPQKAAQSLARRLEVLLALIFIGYLLFSTLLQQSLPEHTVLLARGIFAGVFILNLIWVTRLLGEFPTFSGTSIIRLFIQLVFVGALIAEWGGYRNFSAIIIRLLFGTALAIGIAFLLSRFIKDFFDGLEQSSRAYHRKIRRIIGLKQGEEVPGQLWFRFLTQAVLWLTLIWSVLHIWGFSETWVPRIVLLVQEGFKIGSLQIVPSRILLAVLTFSFLILINSWFKSQLENKWIIRTRMGRGARETVVTMSGYIGVAIAIVVTFGVAGITFTNLAIIAGALSVGIGFGLQNVVNNFVSGLILLFERPIKTGDWIMVGSTEGYVKRIRIRSTQIQTFDRADVIVPNSELISGQVTNWMLYDTRGRIRVPIGVAYGSDTEKVKTVLLEIANSHPSVVTNGSVSLPKVVFIAFGESSLDLELRCFVHNIDERINVVSDINFAIDKAFREHAIDIPFPQRDIHIKPGPTKSELPE